MAGWSVWRRRGRRMGVGLDAPTITTASAGGRVGCGQVRWLARLTPKLDILRLTTRGKARSRLGRQQLLGDLAGHRGQVALAGGSGERPPGQWW